MKRDVERCREGGGGVERGEEAGRDGKRWREMERGEERHTTAVGYRGEKERREGTEHRGRKY